MTRRDTRAANGWMILLMLVGATALIACGDSPRGSDSGFAPIVDAANAGDGGGADDGGLERDGGTTGRPRALFTWAQIEAGLQGSFDVAPSPEPGTEFRFAYSHGIHAQLANGNLLIEGHNSFDRVAEVQLPAVLDGSEATRVGEWIDVTDGLHPAGWSDGQSYILGGLLELGDRIHFTKHQWYNAAGDDWDSLGYYADGTAHGLWNVSGSAATSQRVGGYMSYAPEALRARGITYLAGQQGTSGAAGGRFGPNLFGITFDDGVPVGGEQLATPLIYSTGTEDAAEGWWVGSRVTDAEWIETDTHHAVLFFIYRGLGATWYGLEDAGPDGATNPYGGGAMGYHAEGWSLEVWVYEPEDLLAVSRGEADPSSPVPREQVVLVERLPGASDETFHRFIEGETSAATRLAASYRDGRLVILDPRGVPGEFEDAPRGYVFEL